jgi:hypothetical protein
MKRVFSTFFSIYFALASLMPFTDFSQFSRIYEAVKHSNEHIRQAQAEGRDYDLWTFFVEHFVTPEDHQHSDKNTHDHLPLKVIDSHSMKLSLQESFALNISMDDFDATSLCSFYLAMSSLDSESGLDRPPRS